MPLDPDLSNRILASVEQGFEAQIGFTKQMMRCPSTRGAEQAVQDMVFRALKDRGFALDRFGMDETALRAHVGAGFITEHHSQAPIVVGIHRPREEKGRSLILQAHVDVVPPGLPDMWSHPPFEPVSKTTGCAGGAART
jgi:acetylornithine deacetylase